MEKALEEQYKYFTLSWEYKKPTAAKIYIGEGVGFKREKGIEIHGYKTMLEPNIKSVIGLGDTPSRHVVTTALGERVLSPYVQIPRLYAGAFGEERLKDILKFIPSMRGTIKLAKAKGIPTADYEQLLGYFYL